MKSTAVQVREPGGTLEQYLEKSLGRYVTAPISTTSEMEAVRDVIQKMSPQGTQDQAVTRIGNCLSLYLTGDVEPRTLLAQTKMYLAELGDYPDWAVEEAIAWWIGRENEFRYRRPLPGDLSDVCHRKTELMRVAQKRVEQFLAAEAKGKGVTER